MEGDFGEFTITAQADRIDILKNKRLNILDYKTGKDKTVKAMTAGKAPQLPIEGMIAKANGFPDVASIITSADIESFQYWAFRDKFNATDADESKKAMEVIQTAVSKLIKAYDNEKQPYLVKPEPSNAKDYSDYDHLSRIKEWGTHSDSGNNFGGE